jgi:hypothetical protein
LNKWENVGSEEGLDVSGGGGCGGGGGKLLKNMNLFDFMKVFCSAVFNYTDHSGREAPTSEKALLVKLMVDMYERFDLNVIRTEEKRVEYISRGVEVFSRFWEENSHLWDERFAEGLAEGGHEVSLEEVGELDSHKNTSDL